MTYDSLPIIDRSPKYDNVLIAAGHNMLGLSMAPATGKLVAELARGCSPHLDPGAVSRGPVLIALLNVLRSLLPGHREENPAHLRRCPRNREFAVPGGMRTQ